MVSKSTQKRLLAMVNLPKPVSEMTDEEIDQFAEEVVTELQRGFLKSPD